MRNLYLIKKRDITKEKHQMYADQCSGEWMSVVLSQCNTALMYRFKFPALQPYTTTAFLITTFEKRCILPNQDPLNAYGSHGLPLPF